MYFLKILNPSKVLNKIESIREIHYINHISKELSNYCPKIELKKDHQNILKSIPKDIWMYWHNGKNNLPNIQRACYERIKLLNPSWKIELLSLKDALNKFPELVHLSKTLTPQHFADILRINLLKHFGGVWCDATLLMTQPLDSFLKKNNSKSGFISVQRSGYTEIQKSKKDYEPYIWFIVSEKNNPMINAIYEGAHFFLKKFKSPSNYFWFSILFSNLCNNSENFRNSWLFSDFYDGLKGHLVLRMIKANNLQLARAHVSRYPFHKLKRSLDFNKIWSIINHDGILDDFM